MVQAFACEAEVDPRDLTSNTFTLEWPPRSGNMQEFPEVDRGAWFPLVLAREKIHPGQVGFLEELPRILGEDSTP